MDAARTAPSGWVRRPSWSTDAPATGMPAHDVEVQEALEEVC